MDFQVVRENALKYLGYQAPMFEGLTPGISSLLGECIEEIKQDSTAQSDSEEI